MELRAASGLGPSKKNFGDSPEGTPHPSLLHPRMGLFTPLKKKNFFSFLKLKSTSRKIPQEVVLPAQLGLARGYVLPLNRNCEAWPSTSLFYQSLKWVTPCGGGAGRLGGQPGWNSGFSLPARSLRSGLATPVQHTPSPQRCTSGLGTRLRGGDPTRGPAQAATFPRSPTWAREENPDGPGGVTGLGGAPPGEDGGVKRARGSPRGGGGGGAWIPPGGEI